MVKTSEDLVLQDLIYICASLEDELRTMAGKRLLITGGAGFLGYYFVKTILHANSYRNIKDRVEIHVHDNFMRGVPRWLSTLTGDTHFSVTKRDVTEPLPKDGPDFEFIVHAATVASPTYYRKHPIETMDANVYGIRNLLDYARDMEGKVQGLLFFSSSEIYGDPPSEFIPTPETYRGLVSCTGPRACYDESKRYGETLCVSFAQQYGVPVTIARPFNNYGPGLKITDRRALPDFARNVLNGQDIELLSDGGPTRTFCYVADAIIGYYKILIRGRPAEAYNIGMDAPEISINDLAHHVKDLSAELFGYTGNVRYRQSSDRAYLTDNPQRRCPSIDKARRELEYEPKISLNNGLRSSLLWYNNNREGDET
jgi:dTDP-glucose 4,6-dehydratase/UDP-glucuronate decarboxylase